jgi:hypothetical protein
MNYALGFFALEGRLLTSLGFQPQAGRGPRGLRLGFQSPAAQDRRVISNLLAGPRLGLKPQALQIPPLQGGKKPRSFA